MEFQSSGMAGFKTFGKVAAYGVGQQLLGGPERNGRGSGTGAFERNLTKVKVFRRKVGIGGVVFVEAADGGIAEENATAAIGLEAMLVRVDDDGVGVGDGVERSTGFEGEVGGKGEVATVGGVNVDAELVFFLEGDNPIERIDRANSGCA
jgi:hypothetical protein